MSDAAAANGESLSPLIRFRELTLEEILATLALIVVVGSVSWGGLTRYVMPHPANWTSEMSSIGFAWAVFLGSAAAFRRGGHIMIDTILMILPSGAARLVQIMAALITLLVLAVISVLAIRFTLSTTDIPTTVLRLPQAVIYAAAAVGFCLMTLRHVSWCYETFLKRRDVQ